MVDASNNIGESPLMLAAKNDFPNVVLYLLLKEADYQQKDKNGLTAFDWAVRRALPAVARVFLDWHGWKEVTRDSCKRCFRACLYDPA